MTTSPYLRIVYSIKNLISENIIASFKSHMLARSIFDIALKYWHITGNLTYEYIVVRCINFIISDTQENGKLIHGEYQNEDQFRLHVEAIELLFSAYYHFPKFKDKIIPVLINLTNYLKIKKFCYKNWEWFPHDTLESKNNLILNTHLYTLYAILHSKHLIDEFSFPEEKALNSLNFILSKVQKKHSIIWLIYFLKFNPLLSIIFVPFLLTEFMISRETKSLIYQNGYIQRGSYDIGPHYPIINLNDLLRIYPYLCKKNQIKVLKRLNNHFSVVEPIINGSNLLYYHSDWYYFNEFISNLAKFVKTEKIPFVEFDDFIKTGYFGFTNSTLTLKNAISGPAPAILILPEGVIYYHVSAFYRKYYIIWYVLLQNYNSIPINRTVKVIRYGDLIKEIPLHLNAKGKLKVKINITLRS